MIIYDSGVNVIKVNPTIGFLGNGKTTSIPHLLASKDPAEKQAVLVNEFGGVGVNGALLVDSGVLLRETPSDCMRCINDLPIQIGLNTLLRQGKPDHLLTEPTGLGHPEQVLSLLAAPVCKLWIDLRTTLCILDPRLLLGERNVANGSFRDRPAATDIIAANKTDRTTTEGESALQGWWQHYGGNCQLIHADHGQADEQLLGLPRLNLVGLPTSVEHARSHASRKGLVALSLPAQQRQRHNLNSGQGHQACGWIFGVDIAFDIVGLLEWSRPAPVRHAKGVIYIKEGLVYIDHQGDDQHIKTQNATPPDSRIELITDAETDWDALQNVLLRLRLDASTQGCLRFQQQ